MSSRGRGQSSSWRPVAKMAMTGAASLKKERYEVPAPTIVTADLKLWLDFGRPASYPGTGATIFDISGQGNNFSMTGSGYIHQSPKLTLTQSTPTYATGPASNVFGITTDHTIEIICKPTTIKDTILFQFLDSTKSLRMSQGHVPHGDGRVYYDVRGCCETGQRLGYLASDPTATVKQYVFRTRSSAAPQRQVFENGVSVADSGSAATSALYAWGGPTTLFAGIGGGTPWSGDVYAVRVYNRALTDAEILQNYSVVAPTLGLPLSSATLATANAATTLAALPLTLPVVPGTPLTQEQLAAQIQMNRQLQLLQQQRMFGAAFDPGFGGAFGATFGQAMQTRKKKKQVVMYESEDEDEDEDSDDDEESDDESDEDSDDE